MPIIPSFKHDVFLSYARVDDEPMPGCTEGWVTTLVKHLQWRLAQLCGRRDTFGLWMDHDLARHVDFTPQILSSLRDSAVLMVIFSPGYLASDWCRRERESFLNEVKKRRDQDSSIFIVECDRVPLEGSRSHPESGCILNRLPRNPQYFSVNSWMIVNMSYDRYLGSKTVFDFGSCEVFSMVFV